MKKAGVILCIVALFSSFGIKTADTQYKTYYRQQIATLDSSLHILLASIKKTPQITPSQISALKQQLAQTRQQLKRTDIWLRYLEPVVYKQVNGPLPVEWENEVFEKFEHPYRREGKGLYLAEQYLNEKEVNKDTLAALIQPAITAMNTFTADSITQELDKTGNLLLCNRLYLLNLASIYTTGFECADNNQIVPELRYMMAEVKEIYRQYNHSFPNAAVSEQYLALYDKAIVFVNNQSTDYEKFDHFTFIKEYINPLFAINQQLLQQYHVVSKNYNDYTLTNTARSIFDKQLYAAQNSKGIYSLIDDEKVLADVKSVGKLLFYDPILSGNNERSCASCHKPTQFLTDTTQATSPTFDHMGNLPRNTPSLVDVVYNHLLMLDGKHISLHAQARDVMTKDVEMSGKDNEILEKILSCKEYKSTFKKLLKYTPEEKEVTLEHIISAITYYFSDFSNYYSPFDDAMNRNTMLAPNAVAGFNLFMSKAKCGTCHYVPQFSGVPAPFISSEFEVVGTPVDTSYTKLSPDRGRYIINPAFETDGAFRTTTVRNAAHTMPYMHNGVFKTLDQVISFYDNGGGTGHNLIVPNQTLSRDSLKLTPTEKHNLITFINTLSENVPFDTSPPHLPKSTNNKLNGRKVGGTY